MRQSELYSLVRKLLSARAATERCETCGNRIRFLKGAFYLQKSIMKWEMVLPFCPICDGPIEGSLDYDTVEQNKSRREEGISDPQPRRLASQESEK